MKNIIDDNYEESGKDIDRLFQVIENIASHTKIKTVNLKNLSLPYFMQENEKRYVLSCLRNGEEKIVTVNKKNNELDTFFYKNLEQTRTSLKILNGTHFLLSKSAFNDLLRLVNITANTQSSRYRNLWVSELLSEINSEATLVYREYNGISKVCAIQSPQYRYISQNGLIIIIQSLFQKSYQVKHWHINNEITEIDMVDKNNFGFHIITSDTGSSSFAIYPVYFTKESFVILDNSEEIKLVHRKGIDEQICEKKDRKKIEKMIKSAEESLFFFSKEIEHKKKKKVELKNDQNIKDKIMEMTKKTDFIKAAGKKNFTSYLKSEIDHASINTEFDILYFIWNMKYMNEKDIPSFLRFQNAKKQFLSL